MRKVNVYDIIRQTMVFQTIMEIHELGIDDIDSVRGRKRKKASLNIANIDIKIPSINGYQLSVEEFLPLANDFNKRLLGKERAEEIKIQLENKINSNKKESVRKSPKN